MQSIYNYDDVEVMRLKIHPTSKWLYQVDIPVGNAGTIYTCKYDSIKQLQDALTHWSNGVSTLRYDGILYDIEQIHPEQIAALIQWVMEQS